MSKHNYTLKMLYLKEILERETDYEHGIKMGRILELLYMRGIEAERKSIYSDLEALSCMVGMDIQAPDRSDRTWRLLSRDFEPEELSAIITALLDFDGLPPEKTLKIIRKLYHLCSRHQESALREQVSKKQRG